MKKSIILCNNCGKEFEAENKRINRNKKLGQNLFCSRECAREYRIKNSRIDAVCGYCGNKISVIKSVVNKSKSGKVFCNTSCFQKYDDKSAKWNDERRKKHSELIKNKIKSGEMVLNRPILSKEKILEIISNRKNKYNKELLEKEFDTLSNDLKRKRIILEQEGKCAKCGIEEWFGKKISIEIDHIDGNHNNNTRENMIGLCPNCHSITDTWRGRNKSKREKTATNEEIVYAFLSNGSIRKALISLNMAPKGANYGRVKRALTLFDVKY